MAGKIVKGNFVDLGDKPMDMPSMENAKKEKHYPSLYLNKSSIKKGVGQTGTALIKFKVKSVEMRDGRPTETRIDVMGIKEQK